VGPTVGCLCLGAALQDAPAVYPHIGSQHRGNSIITDVKGTVCAACANIRGGLRWPQLSAWRLQDGCPVLSVCAPPPAASTRGHSLACLKAPCTLEVPLQRGA